MKSYAKEKQLNAFIVQKGFSLGPLISISLHVQWKGKLINKKILKISNKKGFRPRNRQLPKNLLQS